MKLNTTFGITKYTVPRSSPFPHEVNRRQVTSLAVGMLSQVLLASTLQEGADEPGLAIKHLTCTSDFLLPFHPFNILSFISRSVSSISRTLRPLSHLHSASLASFTCLSATALIPRIATLTVRPRTYVLVPTMARLVHKVHDARPDPPSTTSTTTCLKINPPKPRRLRLLPPDPTRFSPFFRLPLELRQMVYSVVLPTSSFLVILPGSNSCSQPSYFTMAYTKAQLGDWRTPFSRPVGNDYGCVNMRPFQVCHRTRDEAFEFLLRQNAVLFSHLKTMTDFANFFPDRAKFIWRVSVVGTSILDGVLDPGTHQAHRKLVQQYPNLLSLEICGQVMCSAPGRHAVHRHGIVNYVRPLALWPLRWAKVVLYTSDSSTRRKVPADVLRHLERMCEEELLRDTAWERKQRVRPKKQREAIRRRMALQEQENFRVMAQ